MVLFYCRAILLELEAEIVVGLDSGFGYLVWVWLIVFFYCRAILLELEAGTSSIKMMAAKHPVSQDLMHGHSTAILHFFNIISSQIMK